MIKVKSRFVSNEKERKSTHANSGNWTKVWKRNGWQHCLQHCKWKREWVSFWMGEWINWGSSGLKSRSTLAHDPSIALLFWSALVFIRRVFLCCNNCNKGHCTKHTKHTIKLPRWKHKGTDSTEGAFIHNESNLDRFEELMSALVLWSSPYDWLSIIRPVH